METFNEKSICYLNDDCLSKIISYLPLREQTILSSLNNRLQNIFYLYLKKKKTYNLYLSYTNWSLEDLYIAFHQIGIITEEFEISKTNEETNRFHVCLDFVLEYCGNLTTLLLENIHVSHVFNQISKSFNYLEILKLKNCSLTDSNIENLSHLQHIKSLDFSKNDKITGKYIEQFKNLEELELNDCNQILNDNLLKIFTNTKNLRFLNLENVINFDDSAIGKLIDNCEDLETLKMYINFREVTNLKRIPNLKKLKNLSINERSSYSMSIFEMRNLKNIVNDVLENLKEQLETLKINFSQFDHDNGLNGARFDAIYKLKNLKELHYIGYLSCYVIYWKNLEEFVQNNKLKILNITYTNAGLGFSSSDFVKFLLNSNNLDEINLTYTNAFAYPRFLYSFIEELNHRKISKPIFTLKINIDKKLKIEIFKKPEYIAAKDLFNLEVNISPSYRHNYYGYMDYEDNGNFDHDDEMFYDELVFDLEGSENDILEINDAVGMKITLNSKILEK